MRERKKLRRWEDEKVGRAQSAWGIGHRAEGRPRKAEEKEGENLRRWEDRKMRRWGEKQG